MRTVDLRCRGQCRERSDDLVHEASLEEYIAFRRQLRQSDWSTAAKRVRPFAAFADAEGAEWITVNLFLRWKDAFGSASTATWADRLSAVRGFAAWLTDSDPRTEIPPKGLVPKRYRRPSSPLIKWLFPALTPR